MQQPPSPQLPPWDPTNDALSLTSASTALGFTSYAAIARRVASDQSKAAAAVAESQPADPITYAVPKGEESAESSTRSSLPSAPALQAALVTPYPQESKTAWYLSQSEPSLVMDAYIPLFFDDGLSSYLSRYRRSEGQVLFASAVESEHKNSRRRNTVQVDALSGATSIAITTNITDDDPVLVMDGHANRTDSESGEDAGDSSLDTLQQEGAESDGDVQIVGNDDEPTSPRARSRTRNGVHIVSSSLPTSSDRLKVETSLRAPLHSETPTATPKAPHACPHGKPCPYVRLTSPPILTLAAPQRIKSGSAAKRMTYAASRLRVSSRADKLHIAARPPPPKLSARLSHINSFDEAIHPFSTSSILGAVDSHSMSDMDISDDGHEWSQMPEIQAPRPLPALGLRADEDGWKTSPPADLDWIPVDNSSKSASAAVYSSSVKHMTSMPRIDNAASLFPSQRGDVSNPQEPVTQPPSLLQLSAHPLIPNMDHLLTRKGERYSRTGHRSRASESSNASVESLVMGSETAKKRRGSLTGKYSVTIIPPFRGTRSVTPNAGVSASKPRSKKRKKAKVVEGQLRESTAASMPAQEGRMQEKKPSNNILQQPMPAVPTPARKPIPTSHEESKEPVHGGAKTESRQVLPSRRSLFGHAMGYALGTGPPVRSQPILDTAASGNVDPVELPLDLSSPLAQPTRTLPELQLAPIAVLTGAATSLASHVSVLDMIQARAPTSQVTETPRSPISPTNLPTQSMTHKSTLSTSSTSSAAPLELVNSVGEPVLTSKGRVTREHMEFLEKTDMGLRQRTMEIKQILAFQSSLEVKRDALIRKFLSGDLTTAQNAPETARLGAISLTEEQQRMAIEDEIDLAERTLEVVRWEIAQFGGIVGSHTNWKDCRSSDALTVKTKEPWEYKSEYNGVPRPTHVIIKWDVDRGTPTVRDARATKSEMYEAADPSSLVLPTPSLPSTSRVDGIETEKASSSKRLDDGVQSGTSHLFGKTPLGLPDIVKPKKSKKVDGKSSKSSKTRRMAEFDFGPPPVHTVSLLSSIKGMRQELLPKVNPELDPSQDALPGAEGLIVKRKARGFSDLEMILGERPKESKGQEAKISRQSDLLALFVQSSKPKDVGLCGSLLGVNRDSQAAPAVFDLVPPVLNTARQATDVKKVHEDSASVTVELKRPSSAFEIVSKSLDNDSNETSLETSSRQRRRTSMSTAPPGEETSTQTMQDPAFDSSDDGGDPDDSRDFVSAEEYLDEEGNDEPYQSPNGAVSQPQELISPRPLLQRKRSMTLTDLPEKFPQEETTVANDDMLFVPENLKRIRDKHMSPASVENQSHSPSYRAFDSPLDREELNPSPTLARFPSIADPPLLRQEGASPGCHVQEELQHPSFDSPYHVVTRSANSLDEAANVIKYSTARVMSGGIKIGSIIPRGSNDTIEEEDEGSPDAMEEFETGESLATMPTLTALPAYPSQVLHDPMMPLSAYPTPLTASVLTSPSSVSQHLPYPPTPVSMVGGLLPSTSGQLPPPKVSIAGQKGGPVEYCGDFRTTGHCRFGTRCRYSHDIEPNVRKMGQTPVMRYRPILRSDPSTHPPNTDPPNLLPACPPGYQLSNVFPQMHHIPGVPLDHQPPVPYTVALPLEAAHPRTAPTATLAAAQGQVMEDENKTARILRSVGVTPGMFGSHQPMAKIMADGEILYDMTSIRTRNPPAHRIKEAEQKIVEQRIAEQQRAHLSRASRHSEESQQPPVSPIPNGLDEESIWKVSHDRQAGPSRQPAQPMPMDPRPMHRMPRDTHQAAEAQRYAYTPMQSPPSYSPIQQAHSHSHSHQSTPSPRGHYSGPHFTHSQPQQQTPVYPHSHSHSHSHSRSSSHSHPAPEARRASSSSMHMGRVESPQVSVSQDYLQALIAAAQQGVASSSRQTATPPVASYSPGLPSYGNVMMHSQSTQPPRTHMQASGYPAQVQPAYPAPHQRVAHLQHPHPQSYTAQHHQHPHQQYPYASYGQPRPF